MRKWVCVTVTITETHQKSMCRPLLVLPERWTSLVQKAGRFGLLGFVVFVLRQAFFSFVCLSVYLLDLLDRVSPSYPGWA